MRTVSEIVGAVQEQQPATEEELRATLLCLYYNGIMDAQADLHEKGLVSLQGHAKAAFERRWRLMRADPAAWLGDRWTPGTEANDKARELSRRIAKKAGVLP